MNLFRNLFDVKNIDNRRGVRYRRSRSAYRMSCSGGSPAGERSPGTGCCGTSCAGSRTGCAASEPRIRTCLCQTNVGCLERQDCGGFRPRGTAETGACPGPCQCEIEDSWNRNVPPKPNCEWVSNFTELRRQWSDHGRRELCKCCNCRPSRPSTPCRPCVPCPPATPCCSSTSVSCPKRDPCQPPSDPCARSCCEGSRLGGGGCCSSPGKSSCCPSESGSDPCPPPSCCGQASSSSSCQPCSPQTPRPILKKRSCCVCAPGGCMCQPMPRNCNCPPPVQIDARADEECSCGCPSTPECACPPSERRFSRTKVKCPNARMCCPLPRQPPGPPCCCVECRPCLPPPCDPCSSSRCRPSTPRIKPCRPTSPCPPSSPCRPKRISPCRKPAPPSPCRSSARSSSRGSSCGSPCRAPGQSSSTCGDNGEVIEIARGRRDDVERDCAGDAGRRSRCRCAHDGKGCADDFNRCCSRNSAGEPLTESCGRSGESGNHEDRAPNVTQVAIGTDKSFSFDRHQVVDHLVTKIEAASKPRHATFPGNAVAVGVPGTHSTRGTSGRKALPCRNSRRAVSPAGGAGNALSNVTAARKSATTPGVDRTPIGTNVLHARLAAKRMATNSHRVAPGRSGHGVHQTDPPSRGPSKG